MSTLTISYLKSSLQGSNTEDIVKEVTEGEKTKTEARKGAQKDKTAAEVEPEPAKPGMHERVANQ